MRAERTPDGHIVITMREAGFQRLLAAVSCHEMAAEFVRTGVPALVSPEYLTSAQRGVADLAEALGSIQVVPDFDALLDALQSDIDSKGE
jgi:hypothetical protein